MARKVFANGTIVKARITFTNPDTKAKVDPTSVTVAVRKPSGTSTTYTYGVSPELVKESTGVFYVPISLSEDGTFVWKWTGSAVGMSVVVYDECDSERRVGF